MLPAEPSTFSIVIGWPSEACMRSASVRAIASLGPPAANGTTMVRGRDGLTCAPASAPAKRLSPRTAATSSFFIIVSRPPPALQLAPRRGGSPILAEADSDTNAGAADRLLLDRKRASRGSRGGISTSRSTGPYGTHHAISRNCALQARSSSAGRSDGGSLKSAAIYVIHRPAGRGAPLWSCI